MAATGAAQWTCSTRPLFAAAVGGATMTAINVTGIPADIKGLRQWVNWRYEAKEDGKPTKVCYQPTGQHAKSNDAATWADFQTCLDALPNFDGIGVMFANGLMGVDLDHHIDERGNLSDFAREVVTTLPTYWEVSPSGSGLHGLCYGTLPTGGRKSSKHGLEMYCEGRYFTVTGNHLDGTPSTVNRLNGELAQVHARVFGVKSSETPTPVTTPTQPANLDEQQVIERAMLADNGGKFLDLWAGSTARHNGDHSSADLALCEILAFWTGRDATRIDSLFRQSGLMRDKWDERHSTTGATYGAMTVAKAVDLTTKVYNPMPTVHTDNTGATQVMIDDGIPAVPMPDDSYLIEPLQATATHPATVTSAAQPGNKRRYTLHNAAEALEPQPPIEWVIDRLFSAGSVSILFGEPGSKKTYALLDAAVCVAHGVKWLDFDTRQSPVLIIDEESGRRRMNRRLGDVLRGHMADGSTPIQYTTLERFQVAQVADALAIEAAIEESAARFVLIDALADVMSGADENAVKDTQPIFIALRGIAERTQAAIVVIHHSNKIGGYRGSTAIKGAVDLLLVAQSKPDDALINFSFDKARDVEPFKFAARAVFDADQVYLSAAEPVKAEHKLSKSQEYVIGYLAEHGPSLIKDIMDNADVCSESTAKSAVYALAKMRMIKRVDGGGPGATARYALAEKATD